MAGGPIAFLASLLAFSIGIEYSYVRLEGLIDKKLTIQAKCDYIKMEKPTRLSRKLAHSRAEKKAM